MNNHKLLMADTVDGIQVVEFIEYPDATLSTVTEFIDALDTLEDDKQIFVLLHPCQPEWAILDDQYGITENNQEI